MQNQYTQSKHHYISFETLVSETKRSYRPGAFQYIDSIGLDWLCKIYINIAQSSQCRILVLIIIIFNQDANFTRKCFTEGS